MYNHHLRDHQIYHALIPRLDNSAQEARIPIPVSPWRNKFQSYPDHRRPTDPNHNHNHKDTNQIHVMPPPTLTLFQPTTPFFPKDFLKKMSTPCSRRTIPRPQCSDTPANTTVQREARASEKEPALPKWLISSERRGWRRVVQNFTPSWVRICPLCKEVMRVKSV